MAQVLTFPLHSGAAQLWQNSVVFVFNMVWQNLQHLQMRLQPYTSTAAHQQEAQLCTVVMLMVFASAHHAATLVKVQL